MHRNARCSSSLRQMPGRCHYMGIAERCCQRWRGGEKEKEEGRKIWRVSLMPMAQPSSTPLALGILNLVLPGYAGTT